MADRPIDVREQPADAGDRPLVHELAALRAVFHATAGAAMIQGDGADRPTYNAAAMRLLDLETPDGRLPEGWVHPDGQTCSVEELPHFRTRRTRRAVAHETLGVRQSDGRVRWLEFDTALWDAAPYARATGVVTTFTDVTARVEQDRALTAARDRLARVLQAAQEGFWEWDVRTGRVEFSAAWAGMLGRSPADLVHDTSIYDALVHPDDRDRYRATIAAHLRGEVPLAEMEQRWRHTEGDWVWLLLRSSVTERDAEHRPLRVAGTVKEIGGRKAAELRLQQALAENEALVAQLQASMARVKTLAALLPICAWCGKLRSDQGEWSSLEQYLEAHTDTRVTHGICPSCADRFSAPGA